jgi:integrase
MMASAIDTPPKRAKLPARRNPYWQGVGGGRGGVSLGYRKGARGPGSWIAKIVVGGSRLEERLGLADDDRAEGAVPFRVAVGAALDWSKRQHASIEAAGGAGPSGLTVRAAVEAYSKIRKRRSLAAGKNAEGRLTRFVLSDEKFASTKLSRLRAETIEQWRERLPVADDSDHALATSKRRGPGQAGRQMARASVNRLLNDLRAALNAAAEKHRRELPAHLPLEIKIGTRALPSASTARKQLLTTLEVKRAIDAAFEVDDTGDFGRLVLIAAVTGARHSQISKLTVADIQQDQSRIMVPGSKKGRAIKAKPPAAVSVSPEVIVRLEPALTARRPTDRLLERWAYREVGLFKWKKHRRRPWGPAYEVEKLWAATIERAGLAPDTVMYAFRHSSIVRGLQAGLPARLVAALHDTSTAMIEEHYSAYIVDASEELSRRAILLF